MAIKGQLQNSDFDDFSASDGWLDCWKRTYSVKQRRIVGGAGDVSTKMVTSWMERINELTEGEATHWKTFGIWISLAVFLKLYRTKC